MNHLTLLVGLVLYLASSSLACEKVKTKKQIDHNYGQVLGLSLYFYEAQRSGKLPEHNRVPWRGDSFLDDGADVGLDLSGGYFDAGDHVKFGFPLAVTLTIIGWGILDYKDGYEAAGQFENGLDMLKWGLDFLIKAHVEPHLLYVDVGDGHVDHTFWGRPEEFPANLSRPSRPINETHPGTDMAMETAAAFAVGSLIFQNISANYSAELLRRAGELYDFGNKFRGKYSDSVGNGDFYGSYSYNDELLWGSAWMYKATKNATYSTNARNLWNELYLNYRPERFGWDDKLAGAQIILAKEIGDIDYIQAATNFCDYIVFNATRTPLGLVWLGQWGSLRSISTVIFACMEAADGGLNSELYRELAKQQMDYILGSTGRSFVVGYGENPPQRPHHRASSCPFAPVSCEGAYSNPGPNPQVLYGALVGGPGDDDSYVDDRGDHVKNEVAMDYNAGFQSALAALNSLRVRGLLKHK